MALSANEEIHDALLRRQAYIAQYVNTLQAQFGDMLDSTEAELRVELERRLGMIAGADGAFAFNEQANAVLTTMANNIADLRGNAIGDATEGVEAELAKFAQSEAMYTDATFNEHSPVVLDTILPSVQMLAAIVTSEPMQGRIMSDWASALAADDVNRIMDAVRIGMAQGRTTDQIVRNVLGTGVLNGRDGVVATTRRNASAIVQTATATVANEARQAYYVANGDIIKEEMWTATLDPRTCPVCGKLDGTIFPVGEGEQTPAHWNCRCVRVAVLDGRAIGERPYTTATEKQLAGMTEEERKQAIIDMTGRAPASMTYQDWLSRQPASFQDEILGPTRAALFRDGMPLDNFVNNGKLLTLDELNGHGFVSRGVDITSPGVKAIGIKAADAVQAQWISDSPVNSARDLFTNAAANDRLLRSVAETISKNVDVPYLAGPIKTLSRVEEKIAMRKLSPAAITDVVRGTFPAATATQADAIVAQLGRRFAVADEGVRLLPSGYFDRPLKLRFPDGTIGEILIAPQALLDAKNAQGHKLYELWRVIADKDSPEAGALHDAQRALYGQALSVSDRTWQDLVRALSGRR